VCQRGLRGGVVRDEEQRSAQRQQILAAAARVFAREGYVYGTMEEIAAEVGGSKGILYYQFESKQDIIVESRRLASGAAADRLARIVEQPLPVRERLELAIRDLIATSFDELSRHVILTPADKGLDQAHRKQVRKIERRYERLLLLLLEEGARDGVFNGAHLKLTMLTIIRACMSPATWFRPKGGMDQETIIEHLTHLLLKSVLKD
jgi:AcrR family transcriptional regulator